MQIYVYLTLQIC